MDNKKNHIRHIVDKMKKKAQQMILGKLIIVLIVAIILVLFATQLGRDTLRQSNREICKLSVLAKSKTKVILESPFYLDCYSSYIDIKKEGIYMSNNLKDNKLDVKFKGKTKDEIDDSIKDYLAKQLYDCWYQFGEGKIDFLGEIDFFKSNIRCFPCANVHFDENFLEGFTYGDWEEYLSEKQLPYGISYKKYITGEDSRDIYSEETKEKLINSKKAEYMSIYFIAVKTAFYNEDPGILKFLAHISGIKKTILSWVYFIDPEDLVEKCERLY